MKLCLGTVQFGLNYGINNTRGQIPQDEILEILKFARDSGITMLDTASAYGESEASLGKSVYSTGKEFQIITKYPANVRERPTALLDTSLHLLKVKNIYAYLFHNYSIFQEHPNYIDDFIKIKQCGKASKIGFSLYHPSEAEYILKNDVPCDIVQVPYNIFDQRFANIFSDLKSRNIEIHVRSIFLQGLFFINPERLDPYFDSVKSKLRELNITAQRNSVGIADICLKFAKMNDYINKIVVGVDSLNNLKQNVYNYNALENFNIDAAWFESLAVTDEQIILPFNWQIKK